MAYLHAAGGNQFGNPRRRSALGGLRRRRRRRRCCRRCLVSPSGGRGRKQVRTFVKIRKIQMVFDKCIWLRLPFGALDVLERWSVPVTLPSRAASHANVDHGVLRELPEIADGPKVARAFRRAARVGDRWAAHMPCAGPLMDADAARPLGKAEDARRGDPRGAAHWVAIKKGVPACVQQPWTRRLCEHRTRRKATIRNARGVGQAQWRVFCHTVGRQF